MRPRQRLGCSRERFRLDWQVDPWGWTGEAVSVTASAFLALVVKLLSHLALLQHGQGFLFPDCKSSKVSLTKGCSRVFHDEAWTIKLMFLTIDLVVIWQGHSLQGCSGLFRVLDCLLGVLCVTNVALVSSWSLPTPS